MGIGKFAISGRRRKLKFALRYGKEHAQGRLASIVALEKIHDARPGIPP